MHERNTERFETASEEARQTILLDLGEPEPVEATVDYYSDRLRCDHPAVDDGAALGDALREQAETFGIGRVVLLAPAELLPDLTATGYDCEALVPGFYRGETDCAVMGLALDPVRELPCDAEVLARVDALLAERREQIPPPDLPTELARPVDAEAIASLLDETFEHYPTPSGDPQYVERMIREGTPFRIVREAGEIVACASADLVRVARTAELTDCATRPDQRGRGLMQAILRDLMGDLDGLGYPTAFTLARAVEPGINIAFQRLGFERRGRMARSCRIGGGIEDMNVWSRRLPWATAPNGSDKDAGGTALRA